MEVITLTSGAFAVIAGEDLKIGDPLIIAEDGKVYVHSANRVGIVVSGAPKDTKADEKVNVSFPPFFAED